MNKMPIPENLDKFNSSFRADGFQHAWDSTSLGELKNCPRRYYLSIIHGWRGKREATPLTFGIHYQKAIELFEKAMAAGESFEAARRVGMRHIIEIQWVSDDKARNEVTLLRSFVWYLEEFQEDAAQTVKLRDGKPAIELSFTLDSGYGTDESPVVLCGHFDRIADFGGQFYVEDNKTTTAGIGGQYFERYSPDNQVSLYTFAAKAVFAMPVAGVLINACHVTQGHSDFARRAILRTALVLDEWHKDLGFWIEQARRYAEAGYWPQNDKACFLCNFKEVCYRSPGVRDSVLKSNFVQRTWNPLERR